MLISCSCCVDANFCLCCFDVNFVLMLLCCYFRAHAALPKCCSLCSCCCRCNAICYVHVVAEMLFFILFACVDIRSHLFVSRSLIQLGCFSSSVLPTGSALTGRPCFKGFAAVAASTPGVHMDPFFRLLASSSLRFLAVSCLCAFVRFSDSLLPVCFRLYFLS